MSATTDNAERVRGAMGAYFDFVSHESEAFRLVFESDLRNESAVRARVDRMERLSVEAITETIMADTGVSRARAEMLAAGLCGAAQAAARFWLAGGRAVSQEEAEQLITTLSWRGIGGFPLHHEH
jgi:AcrR family transcriptional regulator